MARLNYPAAEHLSSQVLGVKGVGALTEIEENLVGVFPVDRECTAVEFWAPQRIPRYSVYAGIAAQAGQYSYMLLWNAAGFPLTTDNLVISRRFDITVSCTVQLCTLCDPTSWMGVGSFRQGRPQDARFPQSSQAYWMWGWDAAADLSAAAGFAGLGGVYYVQNWYHTYAAGREPFVWEIVLPPRAALIFRSGAINQSCDSSATWVERPVF